MKKIIFTAVLFSVSLSFAQNKNYQEELKCLKLMSEFIEGDRFKNLENRGTSLFMIYETLPPGKFSTELNEGFLQIEKEKIKFCKLPWHTAKKVNFTVEDGAGSVSLTYSKEQSPHFQPLSYLKAFAKGASRRYCEDQTGALRTNEILKSVILSAYEKALKKDSSFELPSQCGRSAGITTFDVVQVKKRLLPQQAAPASDTNVTQ